MCTLRAAGRAGVQWHLPHLAACKQSTKKRPQGLLSLALVAVDCHIPRLISFNGRSLLLQIVIAGASETALSCLEQLLVQPHITFTNLTLLAPGGVSVGGVACSYTASLVARKWSCWVAMCYGCWQLSCRL